MQDKIQEEKNILSKFLDWLKLQIDSGNQRFSLRAKDLILFKPSFCKTGLLFILPEVFDRFHEQTNISPKIVQFELKKSLDITFAYTILREGKVIEVFPCMKYF